jgi:hypothetical protein
MNIDKKNLVFRLELAKELELLKQVLNRLNIDKKSIGSIDRAILSLKDKNVLPPTKIDISTKQAIATPLSWGYSVKNFVVDIDLSSSIQYPKIINNAKLIFSIEINGEYFDFDKEIQDPFKHLEFNIVIEGTSRKGKEHILTYHFDRHLEGENPSNEVHPLYHFQLGGRKLEAVKSKGKNFGNKLIIDSPRFMHYPMDFISGLDFVLSNFDPKLWRNLKKDPRYIKILRDSQKRTLKPFVATLAKHFGLCNTANNWNVKDICPQLV